MLFLNIVRDYAIFAFLITLVREIIKDIEDIEGDKLLKAKTLPIVMGKSTAKYIVALVIGIAAILLSGVLINYADILMSHLILGLLSLVFMVSAVIALFAMSSDKGVKLTNNLLKLSMTAGLLVPVYIRLMEVL